MRSNAIVLSFLILKTVVSPQPSISKQYRTDYVYNRKMDAFYKLHIESRSSFQTRKICELEGAKVMVPASQLDIYQLHGMFKNFPDLGNYVWIGKDDQKHESAEVQPIIELSKEDDGYLPPYGDCEVVTRNGDIETYPCYRRLPFICKVEAKDAPYDPHCDVYGQNYIYLSSVGSCYKIPRVACSWNEAYAECRAEGAHLVVFNSKTEAQAVRNFTKDEPRVEGSKASWFILAGFRAEKTAGNATRVFKTIFNETLEQAGFNEWSPNEPSNSEGNEYCGSIFQNDAKLNDVNCAHEYSFVCEKEMHLST